MYKTWLPVTISSEGNCLHTIEGKTYCHDFIPNYKSTLYTCSRKTNYQNNTGISTKKDLFRNWVVSSFTQMS